MKIVCNKIQGYFSDYMDECLSKRQRSLVDLHLRACPICRRELAALKRARALIEDFYTVPDAPEDYYVRFSGKLQRRVEQMPPMVLYRRVYIGGARIAWLLLTRIYRCFAGTRVVQDVLINNRTLPLYALTIAMATLCVATLLLTKESSRLPTSMHGTAMVQGGEKQLVVLPPESVGSERHHVSRGLQTLRTEDTTLETKTPTPHHTNMWRITDAPVADGTVLSLGSDENSDSNSELLVMAEIPTGALSLPSRGMLLHEKAYWLFVSRGISDEPILHRYERKQRDSLGHGLHARFEQMGFARKLVLLETLSLTEVYDSI